MACALNCTKFTKIGWPNNSSSHFNRERTRPRSCAGFGNGWERPGGQGSCSIPNLDTFEKRKMETIAFKDDQGEQIWQSLKAGWGM